MFLVFIVLLYNLIFSLMLKVVLHIYYISMCHIANLSAHSLICVLKNLDR